MNLLSKLSNEFGQRTAEILAKPHIPLLILHGEKDELIPIAYAEP
jgi:pimeloyl-ACP methyl ester carboxylesterase